MITGLVHVPGPGEPALEGLADTLSALVEGVAAGLVGDAVVVAPFADPDVATVADAAGASLVVAAGADPWRAGAAAARREWVLCLRAGDVPAQGWIRVLDGFVSGERDAVVGRLRRDDGPLARLAERLVRRTRSVRAGDVLRRRCLLAEAGGALPVRHLRARLDRLR